MEPSINSIQFERPVQDKSLSLEFLLRNLDLSFLWPILMKKYSLRGRSYDPKAVFRALLLKEIRQLSSRRKLARFLKKETSWLGRCGFKQPVSYNGFYKFIKRVGSDGFEAIFNELIAQINRERPIGKTIAIDSTLLKGYARCWKNRSCSDPDAEWGISTRKEWVFGYKLHVVCDVDLELPIGFSVTPANVYDSTECLNLLERLTKRGIKIEYAIADAGYDTKDNYYLITNIYHAVPIIALNRRNLRKKETRDFEEYLPIKRETEQWRFLYRKRSAVERVFSRLKEELALKSIKVRRIEWVKIHIAISLITMLCVALVAIRSENSDLSMSINPFKF